MTCSQFARVGQLILNKGKWLGENGTAVQMLSKEYVDMMFTPQNPGIPGEFLMSDQYSLLSCKPHRTLLWHTQACVNGPCIAQVFLLAHQYRLTAQMS